MASSKHPATRRIGGPGASHEDRKHPDRPTRRGQHPAAKRKLGHSKVSGGGGESDVHHERSARGKRGGRGHLPAEVDPTAFIDAGPGQGTRK